jgi:hypothetical protein
VSFALQKKPSPRFSSGKPPLFSFFWSERSIFVSFFSFFQHPRKKQQTHFQKEKEKGKKRKEKKQRCKLKKEAALRMICPDQPMPRRSS